MYCLPNSQVGGLNPPGPSLSKSQPGKVVYISVLNVWAGPGDIARYDSWVQPSDRPPIGVVDAFNPAEVRNGESEVRGWAKGGVMFEV